MKCSNMIGTWDYLVKAENEIARSGSKSGTVMSRPVPLIVPSGQNSEFSSQVGIWDYLVGAEIRYHLVGPKTKDYWSRLKSRIAQLGLKSRTVRSGLEPGGCNPEPPDRGLYLGLFDLARTLGHPDLEFLNGQNSVFNIN